MCAMPQIHQASQPVSSDPPEVDHRRAAPHGREVAEVAVAEGRRRRPAGEARADHPRHVGALLLRGRGDPGDGPAARDDVRGVADHEDLRQRPARVRSGSTRTRPARSAGASSQRAAFEACTPAAQITVRAGTKRSPMLMPVSSQRGDRRAAAHLGADALERAGGIGRELLAEGRQHARPGLDQEHPGLAGVDVAELAAAAPSAPARR